MKLSKAQAKQKFQVQLVLFIFVGLVLAFFTYEVLGLFRDAGKNDLLGWLTLSGAGVSVSAGMMAMLAAVLGADILWLLFFVLWLLKRKFHLENPDNTLRLP